MKIKPYEETHMDGLITIDYMPGDDDQDPMLHRSFIGDIGIQIAKDGRIWICIDGVSFLRFKPTGKYLTIGNKLNPKEGGNNDNRY
jgi:hypothetical protein